MRLGSFYAGNQHSLYALRKRSAPHVGKALSSGQTSWKKGGEPMDKRLFLVGLIEGDLQKKSPSSAKTFCRKIRALQKQLTSAAHYLRDS